MEAPSIVGQKFGKLLVISHTDQTAKDRTFLMECICECGNKCLASRHSLKSGYKKSCGCLYPTFRKKCKVDGCERNTFGGANGYCGMHYMRDRKHGDPNIILTHEERGIIMREIQPNLGVCKPTTYKKLMGVHEHRRVMEMMLGRKLKRGEIVHHIDNDKHNNDPSNLVLTTRESHGAIHNRKDWCKQSTF